MLWCQCIILLNIVVIIQKHWKQKFVKYCRDDPNDNNTESESFKYNIKITGKTPAYGNTKDVKIAVSLKYLSNFWRTLEMPLISCKTNLILTWSEDCVISSGNGETKFKISDTKLYVPVVTLSIQDNAKQTTTIKIRFWKISQLGLISNKGINRRRKSILIFLDGSKFSRGK